MRTRETSFGIAAALVAGVLVAGCGGNGGGGGTGGSGSSTVQGSVSNATTAVVAGEERTWLAWLVEDAAGFVRRAWAQGAPDTGVSGIEVTVSNGRDASTMTDGNGDFSVPAAPTGDLNVTFARGNCEGDVPLPDVPEGAVVALEDVDFDCEGARPGRIAEIFQAVVATKPASPQGNLRVCADMGDGHHTRAVMVRGAAFEACSETCVEETDPDTGEMTTVCEETCDPRAFDDVAVGDMVEADGQRVGQGAPSALNADRVEILSSGNEVFCTDEEA